MLQSEDEIRYRGQSFPVLEHLRIGDTSYCVLERLGSKSRPVFRVFERGAVGQMRCLHLLPNSQQTVERLRLLSRTSLPHANLPVIIKSRRRKDDVAVLTKWIDGPSISDYLFDCRRGREPWPSVLIVLNLIRGLAATCLFLHERLGLVHGDLHPGNVILCRHTKRLVPIDFGSAWYIEQTSYRSEGDGIARAYGAPELAGGGGRLGFRSDQFSVMLLGYELLTGQLPYDGLGGKAAKWGEAARLELIGPSRVLKRPEYLPSDLKNRLDELFCRSLQLDPADRYQVEREWCNGLHELARMASERKNISRSSRWLLTQLRRLQKLWTSGSQEL